MAAKRLTALRASVTLENGAMEIVEHGQELPKNLADGERERLEELGALGDPEAQEAEQAALEFATATPEQLQAFLEGANADDVVKAARRHAEANPEVVEALLALERAQPKPRKTVVETLEGLTEPAE